MPQFWGRMQFPGHQYYKNIFFRLIFVCSAFFTHFWSNDHNRVDKLNKQLMRYLISNANCKLTQWDHSYAKKEMMILLFSNLVTLVISADNLDMKSALIGSNNSLTNSKTEKFYYFLICLISSSILRSWRPESTLFPDLRLWWLKLFSIDRRSQNCFVSPTQNF